MTQPTVSKHEDARSYG